MAKPGCNVFRRSSVFERGWLVPTSTPGMISMASTGALTVRGLAVALALGVAGPLAAQGPRELPLKYSGPPTVPAITAGDLMTRLYKYADDSMGGRYVG